MLSENEFSDMQARIRDARYQKESGVGYLVDEMTPQRIRATYIERKIKSNEVVDPFGGIHRVKWFEFISYPFFHERERGLVEVVGTSRGLSALIQQLGILTNWKASFEPLALKPEWMHDFLSDEKIRFDITSLEVSELTLSINTRATVRVNGKLSVLRDLRRMTEERKFSISRATFQLFQPDQPLEIDVSLAGRVTVDGLSPDDGIALCRRAILAAL